MTMRANSVATQRNPAATRQALLQAAFQEIYESGFQAASLDTILSNCGVTKGALYYHFGSKKGLGYAVVDELIQRHILETWVRPLEQAEDPIDSLLAMLRKKEPRPSSSLRLGCPLNNLAQEMSPLDEGFRKRLQKIFSNWREGIARALRRGQQKGYVRPDINPQEAAAFFLAALEGSVSVAKNAQDGKLFSSCKEGLAEYLQALRPQHKKTH